MNKRAQAIALCRVSSLEQLENNSLNRQKESVLKATSKLDVTIPDDGWWSGSISSKKGTNLSRKDLAEMLDYCRKNKHVNYLIVDRPDRFMRSIEEAIYYEVEFSKLGVKVWYASDNELNNDNLMSKFLKFTKYFSAEGSNDDRVEQSIGGATKALQEGRYIFAPKPGYMKGITKGVPDMHPVRGPALKKVLTNISERRCTPSQGLVDLNSSEFMSDGHSLYKMDKFRKIVTDPFYAGVVEINRQVKVRNENGLHEPLITLKQHNDLVSIMNAKAKNQAGPRKNGNPKYPASNHVSCDLCKEKSNGRYVGFDHGNGKNPNLVYEKYRCRGCGRYLKRQELHTKVLQQFEENPVTEEGMEDFLAALDTVWKRNEGQREQEAARVANKIRTLNKNIADKVEAATDPSNAYIKQEIKDAIVAKKEMVTELEVELDELKEKGEADRDDFLRFAYGFVENMGNAFLETTPENRQRCKLVVFPGGFCLDADNNVYTPEISELIRVIPKKKDTEVSNDSQMVRMRRL